MKVMKYLDDYLCSINWELFKTNPKLIQKDGTQINYEKLSPGAKSKILRAYQIHQEKYKHPSFLVGKAR